MELLRALSEQGGWVAFTSPRTLPLLERDARHQGVWGELYARLSESKIAAVGPITEQSLRKRGFRVHLAPPEANTRSLARELQHKLSRGDTLVHPCSRQSLPILEEVLARSGVSVERVYVYEHLPNPQGLQILKRVLSKGSVDWILLSSPLIVRIFCGAVESDLLARLGIGALGGATLETLWKECGGTWGELVVSRTNTIESLVEEVMKRLG